MSYDFADSSHDDKIIAELRARIQKLEAALMMIREGCVDPADLARRVLSEFGIVQTPTPLP